MGASKTLREIRKVVEPLGYELQGINGSGHLVFLHPDSGAIWRQSTTSSRKPGIMRGQAVRNINNAQSASQQFVQYVLKRANIGPHDTKTVKFHLQQLTLAFLAAHPEVEMAKGLSYQALIHSPQVKLVKAAKRGGRPADAISTWELSGALVGVTEVEQEEDEGVAATGVSVHESGVASAPQRELGEVTEAAGADGAGGAGEPADERDATPTGGGDTAGLSLPPELVDQLRNALTGDLQAERDLLRSALADALAGLHAATQAVEAGLSLQQEQPQEQLGRPIGFGPRMYHRLETMREFHTELPQYLTARKAQRFFAHHGLSMSETAAGKTLWSLAKKGIGVKRVSYGVYVWVG